jgi:hypothetical protein
VAVLGVAIVIAVALTTCSSDDDDAVRVLVVGDSVTRLSREEIRMEMGWAGTVDVWAHDGFRTDELLATTIDGVDAEPDLAVVMPGYNDILQENVETDALGQMVDTIARVPCAVWMLIPEDDSGYRTELVRRWNERVREAVGDHESIHLSSAWDELVSVSADFTYLSEFDAVHPNDRGQQAIAQAMATAADHECR